MPDMLVNLYNLPYTMRDVIDLEEKLAESNILIKRALSPNRKEILSFIQKQFGDGWEGEAAVALGRCPSGVYIALQNKQVVGFACYDATAKGFFGPTGVDNTLRGKQVGTALLYKCLYAMRQDGYAYAIIGWVDGAEKFYEKQAGAFIIPDWEQGRSVYSQLIQ